MPQKGSNYVEYTFPNYSAYVQTLPITQNQKQFHSRFLNNIWNEYHKQAPFIFDQCIRIDAFNINRQDIHFILKPRDQTC